MDKITVGLIAALGATAQMGPASASITPEEAHSALHASSVASLLDPVPNAVEIMKVTAEAQREAAEKKVAQLYFGFGHHHHWYHHHHHHHWYHHHHHWYHHHHWHHHYDDDDE